LAVRLNKLRFQNSLIQIFVLTFELKAMLKISLVYFFSLWFVCNLSYGQRYHVNDSVVYEASISNALNKGLKIQKSINIGMEYPELPYFVRNDHQFFLSDQALAGKVTYNNILYKNVNLQYDLVRDEVLTKNFNDKKIILVKEKVGEFSIDGHLFKRLTDSNPSLKIDGYYEILMEDKNVKLLAKRTKRVKGLLSNQLSYRKEELHMEYSVRYFLNTNNNYVEVKNYKQIAKILMNEQKRPKINSKGMTEEASMIAMVNFYTRLKNEK